MKVLSIGTDRKIFEAGSAVQARMIDYGTLFDELYIVVFAQKSLGLTPQKISENVWVYPTNSSSRWWYIKNARALAKKIITEKQLTPQTTIVSVQDPFETGLVGTKLKKKGFKLQVQIHTDFLSPWFTKHSWLNWVRVIIAKRVIKKASTIRVVSDRIKQSLLKRGVSEQKITVLPIFVPAPEIKKTDFNLHLQFPQWATIILMASRLTSEKNISQAIESFKKIPMNHPSAGLVIVGEGECKENLQQLVKKAGIKNNVAFVSWQSDLSAYYATADIFLSTSLYEGYGLTLIEAARASLCIVTSDVGVVGSVLKNQESAVVVPVNDVFGFTSALKSVITDKQLRAKLATGAKVAVEKISTDKSLYLQYYMKASEDTLNS